MNLQAFCTFPYLYGYVLLISYTKQYTQILKGI